MLCSNIFVVEYYVAFKVVRHALSFEDVVCENLATQSHVWNCYIDVLLELKNEMFDYSI